MFFVPTCDGFQRDELAISDGYIFPIFSTILAHAESLGQSPPRLVQQWQLLTGWADSSSAELLDPQDVVELANALEALPHTVLLSECNDGTSLRECLRCASIMAEFIRERASQATALYVALRHLEESFDDMIGFVIECGGDVDTIGAMAGALWGLRNGPDELPPIRLEGRGRLISVADGPFQLC